MRTTLRSSLALAAVALVVTAGCSDSKTVATTAASSSSAPVAVATTAAPPTTSAAPTTTVPAPPASVEAGGYRLVVTRPTANATIGPATDLCYSLTGPAAGGVAFDGTLMSAATNNQAANTRVAAAVGTGSVRLNLATPDSRYYDMLIQVLVNGQAVDKLSVRFGVLFAAAAPS